MQNFSEMRNILIGLMLFCEVSFLACVGKENCKQDGITVDMNVSRNRETTVINIWMRNNTQDNIYLSDITGLLWGINAVRVDACGVSDVRFDVCLPESIEQSAMLAPVNEQAAVAERGPIGRKGFKDSVANELRGHLLILSDYYNEGMEVSDTSSILKGVMSCTFLPRGSSIKDSIVINNERWRGSVLRFQYIYPSTYFQDYIVNSAYDSKKMSDFYSYHKIIYPDTVLGYLHYKTPITSEIMEVVIK